MLRYILDRLPSRCVLVGCLYDVCFPTVKNPYKVLYTRFSMLENFASYTNQKWEECSVTLKKLNNTIISFACAFAVFLLFSEHIRVAASDYHSNLSIIPDIFRYYNKVLFNDRCSRWNMSNHMLSKEKKKKKLKERKN